MVQLSWSLSELESALNESDSISLFDFKQRLGGLGSMMSFYLKTYTPPGGKEQIGLPDSVLSSFERKSDRYLRAVNSLIQANRLDGLNFAKLAKGTNTSSILKLYSRLNDLVLELDAVIPSLPTLEYQSYVVEQFKTYKTALDSFVLKNKV